MVEIEDFALLAAILDESTKMAVRNAVRSILIL